MGLRITANLYALTALRSLRIVDRNMATSIERLSTGLRINRAADDPSGLVISEGLRLQLAGLNQAVENSKSASNILSIAESALQEVSNLLTRIQDSITFVLNTGSITESELLAEQDVVDQAIAEIDRIAATTRFGQKELLNGNVDVMLVSNRPAELDDLRIRSVSFAPDETQRTLTITITRDPQRAQIRIVSAYTDGSTILRITGPRGTEDVTIASGVRADSIASAINTVAEYTGVFASGVASGTERPLDIFSEEFGKSQLIKIEVISGQISGYNVAGEVRILDDQGNLVTTGVTQTPLDPGDIVSDTGLDAQVRFEGQIFTGYGRKFNILSKVASLQFKLTTSSSSNQISLATTSVSLVVANTGMNFQLNVLPRPTDQLYIGIQNVASNMLGFEAYRDRISESVNGVSIGAASDDWILTGGYLNSLKTGSENDLTQNPENAKSISMEAANQISAIRGFLGAVQSNILQSNISSLEIAVENITASLSDVRDVDFAAETINFTKYQILYQSGIIALATSNLIPQYILTLLE
jgi:flagellin